MRGAGCDPLSFEECDILEEDKFLRELYKRVIWWTLLYDSGPEEFTVKKHHVRKWELIKGDAL